MSYNQEASIIKNKRTRQKEL